MAQSNRSSVLIIGAGPAGLATAGRLRKMGISFTIVESSENIASSWRGHYDRLHLHTVKEYSHLPHLEFPKHYPRYVSRQHLIDYCEDYARRFDIQPVFNRKVQSIQRKEEDWEVLFDDSTVSCSRHVVIATGANRVPNIPEWPGKDTFEGTIVHSRNYKNPQPFIDQKVLVVGMGNTGAEIALDFAEHDIDVTISVRSAVSIVPRDFRGRPVQVTAKKLAKLPFGLGDRIGAVVRRIAFGNLERYGIPVSTTPPAVQLRESGKTPVIDLGTVAQIKAGRIQVVPAIEFVAANSVQFVDGSTNDFDAIILATGYRPELGSFIPSIQSELDRYGLPLGPVATSKANAGLYFVGFDNYQLGGILGTIYSDSKTVADQICQHLDHLDADETVANNLLI